MDNFNQIFSATYSGVEVYELILRTGSVMRRKKDGWVNATHILKTADFPKAKRTRILEKDVQTGEHEKVQGGYGKYQGTWVPLERAKAIAKGFGVDDILAPLMNLESTSGMNSPPPAPKHHHASKNNSIIPQTTIETRKKAPARKTASMPTLRPKESQVDTVQKKRGRPSTKKTNLPTSNPNLGVFVGRRLHSTNENSQADGTVVDEDTIQDDIQQIPLSNDFINDGISSEIDDSYDLLSSPSDFMSDTDLANALNSPPHHGRSAQDSLVHAISSNQIRSNGHGTKWIDTNSDYITRLLDYFMAPDDGANPANGASFSIPEFILHPPKDISFDKVIDDEGHSLFHWACSMGNALVVEAWIQLGANYRVVNKAGETPLMRSVLFTNSFNKKTFAKLVDLLGETLFEIDSSNKTVLHHIANAASSKSRIPSAFYYMDILLARISAQSVERLQSFLNLQDNNGDTALHLCAKHVNRKCIKLLLEYKARHDLKNNQGLIASDILLKNDRTPKIQQRYEIHLRNQQSFKDPNQTQLQQQGSRFAEPHVSEAAIEATHKVSSFLIESLNNLSQAYDAELTRKEADVFEVEALLKDINESIRATQDQLHKHIGKVITVEEANKSLDVLESDVQRYKKLTRQSEIKLKRLKERAQKKKLETLVAHFIEEQKSDENQKALIGYTDLRKLKDVVALTKLQLHRKRLITEIVNKQGSHNPRMYNYKRLIAAACEMNIEDVEGKLDQMLKEIEEGQHSNGS